MPAEILYDRMKTAVTGPAEEGGIAYNAKLLALAAPLRLRCRAPASPIGPRPRVRSSARPATSARTSSWPAGSATSTISTPSSTAGWPRSPTCGSHATTRRVVSEAFAEERPGAQAAGGPYRARLKLERRVSHEGMVSVGGNLYSVPDVTRRARVLEVHTLRRRDPHSFLKMGTA